MNSFDEEAEITNASMDKSAWPLLEKLVLQILQEQKRSRRWKVFFRCILCLFFLMSLVVMHQTLTLDVTSLAGDRSHTAMVQLNGVIGDDVEASAKKVIKALQAAFADKGTKGVVLRVNSPGGSPVQSGYIHDEIYRLRKLHPNIPLYAVIVDIGASGGYYVAVSAESIYADKASLVGSIGVISAGFGFVGAMEKMGITRRVYASGENKAFLDPFKPENKEVSKHWQASLDIVHKQFIDVVKQGRGKKLSKDPKVFSGMIWAGEKAKALGLVDEMGNVDFVAREVIGAEKVVDYTLQKTWERVMRELGANVVSAIVTCSENRFQ